jgi:hypothetical protein
MKFNNLIQQSDYTLIIPRTGVKPLDLIWQKDNGFFSFFSPTEGNLAGTSLKDNFVATKGEITYPKIQKAEFPQLLSGKDVMTTESSFAASFLQDNTAKLNFNKSKTVLFSYEDNVSTVVDWTKIEDYLQDTQPKPSQVERLQKGQVYIILGVLASKKLSIEPMTDFKFSAEITSDQIAQYFAEVKASGGISKQSESIIKQEGDKYLVFALQTAKILYKNGKYSILPKSIIVRNSTNDKPAFEKVGNDITIV